ncbi:tyrosine-type recombinase/integrase [Roseibium aggregatum]|uniref:tyrosine-type recombinase/integrase n=1 Tax=Roseibium aggregatum TaxID=187304 RepID=UPI001A8C02CE|nr:tyrosine-type recombinase/integrase [Roseibium aggregatum]MBN8179978.1 tyrosine-type recombinase/integrase [Roseibium aggregatum]UES45854.1 tyrosine-type recombinase/integrase [Roseibium aggregatum]
MRKHHPKNERIKRQYFAYLEEAKRMSDKTTDQVAAAIALFEQSTGYKDFTAFHIEQARKFKRDMAGNINAATGKPLAKATMRSRLSHVKAFFHWLAGQPGYKSRIKYSDSDYFNMSGNDTRIATAKRENPVPSAEQIRHVLNSMRAGTDIKKRNRALIAFTFLTGLRDDAMASLKLKHVNPQSQAVFQDAREVRTKNRKTVTTWFFPVGEDVEQIVGEWIDFLVSERVYGPDDPLFPSTRVGTSEKGGFAALGLTREHWSNAGAIRKIFKQAFETNGLPYFNPHSFRKTLAQIGERTCRTPEDFKAWSQNLGHEQVLTTFTNYGAVSSHRQAEIMNNMRQRSCISNQPINVETLNRAIDLLVGCR